jgi:hypothetical protein
MELIMVILLIDDPNNEDHSGCWCTLLWLNFTDSITGKHRSFDNNDWTKILRELNRLDICVDNGLNYLIFKSEVDKLAFALKWG